MKPFKLRVDWTCANSYDAPVDVELHIMDEGYKVIHQSSTPVEGARWARKWLADRGFDFWCDINNHQRRNDTHITLHPRPFQNGVTSDS